MSKEIQIVQGTQKLFDQFQSLYYFSANEDNASHNQGLFSLSLITFFLLVNNKPIALVGVAPLWNGVGEGWLLGTNDLAQHNTALFKFIRAMSLIDLGLHRLQIYVEDLPKSHRLAKLLGFTFEGLLRKHSQTGKDHALYSKI